MRYFTVLFYLIITFPTLQSQSLLFKNANYLHPATETFQRGNISINEGKITHLKKKRKADQIIAADSFYIIPGLVDAHIHLFQSGGLYTRPDAVDLREFYPYEKEREWLKSNAEDLLKRYLKMGITTVVDMGGPLYQLAMRDSLAQQKNLPDLWITGPLVSTYQPPELDVADAPIVKVKTTEEVRELVRQQLPVKPAFIKIWYIALPTQSAESTYDIVEATIEEAHKNGLKAAVHATQL
ncbi:MAG: amidohydrolase family protein, partial [Saprospiraceae bacterium]